MVRLLVKQWSTKAERWYAVEDCGPYEPDNLRNGAPKDDGAWLRFAHRMVMNEGCGGSKIDPGAECLLTVREFGRINLIAEVQFAVEEDGSWSKAKVEG